MSRENPFEPEESEERPVTREEVLQAYRSFVEQGITNPYDLNSGDSEVRVAQELFDQWQEQLDAKAGGDEEAERRANLAKTMLYIDAGFTDENYLREVLGQIVSNDIPEKQSDNPERIETRREIAQALLKVRNLIPKSE